MCVDCFRKTKNKKIKQNCMVCYKNASLGHF